MTCRERLVGAIRAPGQTCASFQAGLVLLPLNLILFLLSFSSNHWLKSSLDYGIAYTYRHQGLWRYCQGGEDEQCCGYINDIIGQHSQSVPAYTNAVRSFMVIALIAQTVCLLSLFCSVFCGSPEGPGAIARLFTTVGCLGTAVSVLLSIIIYGSSFANSDWTSQYNLSWSYGIAVVSGIFYLVGAVIFIVDWCSDRDQLE